jgi:hypothetical protein
MTRSEEPTWVRSSVSVSRTAVERLVLVAFRSFRATPPQHSGAAFVRNPAMHQSIRRNSTLRFWALPEAVLLVATG